MSLLKKYTSEQIRKASTNWKPFSQCPHWMRFLFDYDAAFEDTLVYELCERTDQPHWRPMKTKEGIDPTRIYRVVDGYEHRLRSAELQKDIEAVDTVVQSVPRDLEKWKKYRLDAIAAWNRIKDRLQDFKCKEGGVK